MKNFIFILFCCPYSSFAQTEIINTSLTIPTADIAYRFYENMFQVQHSEKDSTIILLSNNDTLQRFGFDFYTYLYNGSENKIDTILALRNDEIISQKIVRIENLKIPKIFLGDLRDSLVTKNQLFANPGLIVTFEPQLAKSTLRVLSFTGEIIKQNGKTIPFEQVSNKFQNSGLRLIRKMKKGETLIIKSAKTICPDCMARNMIVNLRFTVI